MSDLHLPDPSSWEAVLNRHQGWAVYTIKGKRKKKLVLVDTGSGGFAEALKQLKDDQIQFFGFRVTGIDERAGAKSVRQKVVKVCYIGPEVSTMQRASSGVLSGPAFNYLRSCHVQFTTSDKADISEESIEAKLRASGGAHQVQRYDFTNAEGGKAKRKKKAAVSGAVTGKSGASFEIADSTHKTYVADDAAYVGDGSKKELTKEEAAAKSLAERRAREGAVAVDKAENSNIASYGGADHERQKKLAAAAEVNWKGAGENVGLQIWRVENASGNFGVKVWPKEKHGHFFDGDAYIVLQTYKTGGGDDGALAFNLYFWIGKDSTQDERGVVVYKTIELDDYLGGKPVQCRCFQGNEPERFLELFAEHGGLLILAGGVDSGFNIVKPEEYEPRLLHVKGKGKNISISQVSFSASSLNKGDVFVLDNGLQIYQWNGPESNPHEKVRANKMVQEIYANRQRGDGIVKSPIVLDDDDCDEFWGILKGSPDDVQDAKVAGDDEDVHKSEPELFCVSDKTGKITYERVAVGKLKKEMLGSGDVYVLDTDTEVYVWIGSGANKNERQSAMLFAQDYLSSDDGPDENSPITRLVENDTLPFGFRECFEGL